MTDHLADAIRLAAIERKRWSEMDRLLREGGMPLGSIMTPWRENTGILTYNQQLATGTANITDHSLANFNYPPNPAGASSAFFCDAFVFYATGTTDFAASATVNFWVKIGATKAQTAAVALPSSAATLKRWDVMALVAIRSVGAGGTAMVQILGRHESLATPYLFAANYIATPATTAINTTAQVNLALGHNFSASSASNNNRCDFTYVTKVSSGAQ